MGQRVRLKESYVIPGNWTIAERAVLKGLKKYGALVADNGNFFSISAVPDDRWGASEFSHLSSISITNFEVIQTAGSTEGPRSPGAPVAHAGSDLVGAPNVPIQLSASVSNALPVSIRWILYSGPGTVLYDNSKPLTNTTVTFGAPGNYILMLAADDGVHAVAYDALDAT